MDPWNTIQIVGSDPNIPIRGVDPCVVRNGSCGGWWICDSHPWKHSKVALRHLSEIPYLNQKEGEQKRHDDAIFDLKFCLESSYHLKGCIYRTSTKQNVVEYFWAYHHFNFVGLIFYYKSHPKKGYIITDSGCLAPVLGMKKGMIFVFATH